MRRRNCFVHEFILIKKQAKMKMAELLPLKVCPLQSTSLKTAFKNNKE